MNSCTKLLAACLLVVGLLATADKGYADRISIFTDFTGADPNLSLVGDAQITGGNLQLADEQIGQVGGYRMNFPLSTSEDIKVSFTFEIQDLGSLGRADGIALSFLPTQLPANGLQAGGNIGIYNAGLTGVAVEFDTFDNFGGFGDPNNNHASINDIANPGLTFAVDANPVDDNDNGLDLVGNEIDVCVTFDASELELNVEFGVNGVMNNTLTADMTGTVFDANNAVAIGLTAATASEADLHLIKELSIEGCEVNPVPTPAAWWIMGAGLLGVLSLRRV